MPHPVFSCHAISSLVGLFTGGQTLCPVTCDALSAAEMLVLSRYHVVDVTPRVSACPSKKKFFVFLNSGQLCLISLYFLHSCSPYLPSCWATSRVASIRPR